MPVARKWSHSDLQVYMARHIFWWQGLFVNCNSCPYTCGIVPYTHYTLHLHDEFNILTTALYFENKNRKNFIRMFCVVVFSQTYGFLSYFTHPEPNQSTVRVLINSKPGAVAPSEACPLGMQAAPSSIPTSGTFFRGDLVMKQFLRPFSLFRWVKKSSCQLLAKECALNTGKHLRRFAQEQWG